MPGHPVTSGRTAWRLFFALCPPAPTRQQIADCLRHNPAPARPVPPENWHMTMLFVGMVPPATGKALSQLALDKLPKPFGMRLDRCGYWARPGVGWLAPSQPPAALFHLHRQLVEAALVLNLATEKRPWRPHVTVWKRLRQPWRCHQPPVVDWPVRRLYLLRSFLRPQGPQYCAIASWPLASGRVSD